jgi:hypothetical protein
LPPEKGPVGGFIVVITGIAVYRYGLGAEVPFGVVTAMLTEPTVPEGAVAVILLSLLIVKVVAAVPPNMTREALVNPPPLIITALPPVTGPALGLSVVIPGTAV